MRLPRQVRDYRDVDPLTHGVDRGELLYDRLAALGLAVEGRRLLDVGCGYGGLAIAASRRGASVTAVDADASNVEVVQRRTANGDGHGLNVRQASVLDLPFPENSFEYATMIGVLEWVGYSDLDSSVATVQARGLAEIRRVLRPDGRLIIGTKNRLFPRYLWRDAQLGKPLLNVLPRGLADRLAWRMTGGPYRAHINSLRGWRRLLAAGGFRLETAHVPLYHYQYPLGLVPVTHRGSVRPFLERAAEQVPAHIVSAGLEQGRLGRRAYYEAIAWLGALSVGAGTFLLVCVPDGACPISLAPTPRRPGDRPELPA